MEDDDIKISFSLGKKKKPKRKIFEVEKAKDERVFISHIEEGKIDGRDVHEKVELIIPLIKNEEDNDVIEEEEEVEEISSINEVFEEGKYGLVKIGKKRLKRTKRPLLHKKRSNLNKDDDEIFNHEINQHPDDVDHDVYEKIPVEEFGVAMLRGMGWRPDSEKEIKVYEAERRPQRLGLGASLIKELPPKKDSDKKNGTKKIDPAVKK